MKAKSITGSSANEIEIILQQTLSGGFKPTLAIVFISIRQNSKSIRELLNTHNIDVIGATSCHEINEGHESEGGIAIMQVDLSRDKYKIVFEEIGTGTLQDAATRLSRSALEKFANPSLILLSTSLTETGVMLDGET